MRHINFNRKIGQRSLDDNVLSDFIQNFEKIPIGCRSVKRKPIYTKSQTPS